MSEPICLAGIFDSHAHYDDERFAPDRNEVLSQLPRQGVSYVMNAASDLDSAAAGLALARAYPHVYCAAGIHPHEASKAPADYLDRLKKLLAQPKVMAVGEIGLDYHYNFSPREIQLQVFEEQLILADKLGLPVIIHDREAHEDTLRLLKQYRPKGVVHCFSGSAQMAREVTALGLYVGFTGVITFKNARKPLEALRAVPKELLLMETDAPYMAPEPLRGRRCDSTLLAYVAQVIARELTLEPQEVVDLTAANAKRLFGIS
ncbi:MAG: TatD family hydrolase [Oscillospiraceae bacterium]|jgi:TatD DNase family protein